MGASSSGLLDETKINNIKGLVNSSFQSFSVFYRQQFLAAYIGHLHQEVEPKKEGRGLLLTRGPHYAPEEVMFRGSVKFSCWDEPGKKCRERYAVLRRDYRVEIHENVEAFSHGGAAKMVLRPVGGRVFTTEEESRAHLEHTCAGILNGVKEDSSPVGSSPDVPAVYLHLPYMGHTCFLFRQEQERDDFLSALKTCIRHGNLDPWCEPSYESQAFIRALRLYRQDKGCYQSWEMLLGTEEQVLASQVMEEVLSWLQSQLPSRVKAKKTEGIRQWLVTVQACYTLVLEQLISNLEALREECRQTASANQALIRSNLDQIMSSRCFLEEKVKACIREEAVEVCTETVAPYMSSILDALTENISAGIQAMQHTLHTKMDSAFMHTNGQTEDTKEALSPLRSISLDQCYRQVENLTDTLDSLKQRFGLSSAQRLVHSAHLEMEKLVDSAVYTLELFLQSSARLQPSQVPVKMEKAKERVLKQLDYDSRVVQRRVYQEALLEITLPALTSRMDRKWKSQLQQFEQYIFSDYSSFILVHNVYDDVLRNLLSEEINTVVQDAASKKSSRLLLDTSDLTISQYSLLGQTPPLSAPHSPTAAARDASSAAPGEGEDPGPVKEDGGQTITAEADPLSHPDLNTDNKSDPSIPKSCDLSAVLLSPVIVVTQEFDEPATEQEEVQDTPSTTESTAEEPSAPVVPDPGVIEGGKPDAAEGGRPDPDAVEGGRPDPDAAEGGRPDPDAAEGGTSDPDAADGGRPDAAEGGTPDPDAAEGGRPDPDAAEGGRPDPDAAEGGTSDPDAAEGGRPDPDAAEGGRPDPDAADGGRSDAAEGGTPDPDAAEGGRPDPDAAEGGTSDPDAAEGGRSDPDAAEGGRPDPDAAEGGRPDPDAAEGGTPDPDAAEGGRPDPDPDSLDSSLSAQSSSQSTEGPAACAESNQSETPDLSISVQHTCPSSCTDQPMKISLGSLSEAIGGDSSVPSTFPTTPQHATDRAVYLTGEIKDSWEVERGKEEEQVCNVSIKDKREEEKVEGQMLFQSGGKDGGCRSSEQRDGDTEVKEDAKANGDNEEKGGGKIKEEGEVLQSPQPIESQPESSAEMPLDSVAAIRELVTEITEVEMVINPCP